MSVNSSTVALITGKSLSFMAVTARRPIPGQPNTVSTNNRTGRERCQDQSGVCHRDYEGVSEGVFPHDSLHGDALRPCELDELGVEHFRSIADRVRRTRPAAEPEPKVTAGSM